MQVLLHQTNHKVADFKEILNYLENISTTDGEIHLFPELFLCGYPLQDLCLQKAFIDKYIELLDQINQWSKTQKEKNVLLLMGGLEYELSERGLPLKIKNVIYELKPGRELKSIYTKRLLPSYDIFDESKYFHAGEESITIEFNGKTIAPIICEDMWMSNVHHIDPIEILHKQCKKNKTNVDLIINVSASPFNYGKLESRHKRAAQISEMFDAPFAYVNRVGGEDEILFDGASFVVDQGQLLFEAKSFEPDLLVADLDQVKPLAVIEADTKASNNTWEDLFNAQIFETSEGYRLNELSDESCQRIIDALCFGLQEYARKCGFQKFLVALSGGIDSALVLTLVKLSLKEGQSFEAVYMPSQHSSTLSYDLSFDLCKNLGITLKTFPIKFLHSATQNAYLSTFSEPLDGVADENIQSRLRGALIYTRSNKTGAMVINTSNKSELAVGYSTQYGDSVGAISMLGDVYKSEVFQLCTYINKKYGDLIPEGIITRPPSAELRPGQVDTDSLPPYEVLDAILEGVLSYQFSMSDLVNCGFSVKTVEKVLNLYRKSEYKRSQFCPIIKVRSKSFGFGYRIPTSKNSNFYIETN